MLHFGKLLGAFAAAGLALVCLNAQQKVSGSSRSLAVTNTTTIGSWSTYGGDKAFQRYSPLDQINRENVNNLQFVWHRPAVDPLLTVKFPDIKAPNYFRGTPILIDGLLYAPDGVGLVEAFDAATGQTRWVQQPVEPTLKEAAGQSTRGVAYWTNGSDKRIVSVRGEYLYAMSAKTGQPCRDFGENGRLSLNRHTKDDAPYFGWPGPFIVNDVIIVGGNGGGKAGSGYGDDGYDPRAQPEDIRGFDIHSGKLLWTFHVLPRKDEPGYDTWGKGSAEYMGNMAAWASLTADEKLGYVYIPLSAPTASHYGGQRPGKNLYSDSLLCLNAKTGKLVWFYQLVHHDLWEYDSATPPILGDIKVDGKKIQAVIAADKTGFLYVFNRITGEPVWPIEDRPVPKSTVPGEEPWPTQPFPTKPPPFDRQGFSEADLIDYTPELHQKALEIVSHFIMGPLFTPPSIRDTSPGGKLGTLVLPGGWGAGNWNTGAFDPETGMYYAVSMTQAGSFGLTRNPDPENPMLYGTGRLPGAPRPSPEHRVEGPTLNIDGLPIYKGPYGRITAIDLNKGTIAWMVPNGDGPRYHPLIKDLHLGPLGTAGRPVPLVTKTLLFLSESSDATMGRAGVAGPAHFRAYDKATGAVIWEKQIPVGTTGGPITYVSQGKQYIVLPVGGNDYGAGWLALAMASPADAVDVTRAPIKAPTIAAEATPAIFTLGQADRGKKIFETKCSTCHGVSTWGPSLEGESFWKNWNQKSARSLYSSIIGGMPPDRPGSLSEQTVLDIVAYLFHTNNLPSGDKEIVSASELNTVPVTRPK